jgi:hypothetical protein
MPNGLYTKNQKLRRLQMSATTDGILEQLKTLTLLEASELVKQIEEAFWRKRSRLL